MEDKFVVAIKGRLYQRQLLRKEWTFIYSKYLCFPVAALVIREYTKKKKKVTCPQLNIHLFLFLSSHLKKHFWTTSNGKTR